LAGSTLDLNGNNDTFGILALQSGTAAASTVAQGVGTLTLLGNIYVGLTGTGATGVSLAGAVNFGLSPREVNVTDGAASSDLLMSGSIGGGTTALTKQSAGVLAFATGATETYLGATTVNQGALFVDATTAAASNFTVNRGAALGGTGTIQGSVTVNSQGILTPGDIGGGAGPDLSGTGILSTGSL